MVMKNYIVFVVIMLLMPIYHTIAQNSNEVAARYNSKHSNDLVVNKTNKTIIVEIQCLKTNGGFLVNGRAADYRSQEDLKQLAHYNDVLRSAQFFIEPNKEVKFFDSFIKNNPVDKNTGYWVLVSCSVMEKNDFKSKPLSLHLPLISSTDVLNDIIKARKYTLTILNDELQVEAQNTVIP